MKRVNLREIGLFLSIAGEFCAIAANAVHQADAAIEQSGVRGAIEVKAINNGDDNA